MSVLTRYTGDVGDRDPTWRYLLEKVAHTALITLALFALAGVPLLPAAAIATVLYLVIGKVAWLVGARKAGQRIDTWFELRDSFFDGVLGGAVVAIAFGHVHRGYGWVSFGGVLLICAILFNNRWSSPGNQG